MSVLEFGLHWLVPDSLWVICLPIPTLYHVFADAFAADKAAIVFVLVSVGVQHALKITGYCHACAFIAVNACAVSALLQSAKS